MKRFLLSSLFGLASCGLGATPFVQVTVTVPLGVVTPAPEILEFTVTSEAGEDVAQVNVSDISFPMSVNLTFERDVKRQDVHIVVRGFVSNNPNELFFAEGDSKVGKAFLELVAQYCGNGITEAARGEACDDGNLIDGDSCSSLCQLAVCGNDILEPGESCEDGNPDPGDGCSSVCQQEFCGDGVVNNSSSPEVCDDGNAIEGDGCDSNCTISACGNGILAPQEICFREISTESVGAEPTDVKLGDIDNNGLLDIAVATFSSVSILLQQPDGTFSNQSRAADNPAALVLVDLNQDSFLDIAMASSNDVAVLRQQTGGGNFFLQSFQAGPLTFPQDIVAVDADLNGLVDISVVVDIAENGLSTFVNTTPNVGGPLSFSSPGLIETTETSESMVLGNFDQDVGNRQDIAVVVFATQTNLSRVDVFSGGLAGSLFGVSTSRQLDLGQLPSGTFPNLIDAGDLNQDSVPDVVVVNPKETGVSLLINNGSGQLGVPLHVSFGFIPRAVVVRDVTGDSIPDILVTGLDQLAVLPLLGGLQFGEVVSFPAGVGASSFALGDLNQDGLLDAVTANVDANTISILLANP